MLDQIDSLESLIDRISMTLSELKAEKNRMGEELKNLQGILDEKELEMVRLNEEREITEKRLAALLEKLRTAYEPAGEENAAGAEGGSSPLENEEELREAPDGDLFKFGKDPHQGDLADRF
jgi:FtsZ-binding cell division protein ZapB